MAWLACCAQPWLGLALAGSGSISCHERRLPLVGVVTVLCSLSLSLSAPSVPFSAPSPMMNVVPTARFGIIFVQNGSFGV